MLLVLLAPLRQNGRPRPTSTTNPSYWLVNRRFNLFQPFKNLGTPGLSGRKMSKVESYVVQASAGASAAEPPVEPACLLPAPHRSMATTVVEVSFQVAESRGAKMCGKTHMFHGQSGFPVDVPLKRPSDLCVCVYVCMYVCMYVCKYVSM